MRRRRVTILASSLFLIFSMFVPATSGAVLAKDPNLDVRGKWQLVWSGFGGKSSNRLHATADIRTENLRTGTFSGRYEIPEQPLDKGTYQQYHNEFTGTVRGHTARLVGVDAGEAPLDVVLSEQNGLMTLSGSRDGIDLRGTLVDPALPQGLEVGDRPSSVDGQCMSALGAADVAAWCLVEVADDLGHKNVEQPSGNVMVQVTAGTRAVACSLIAAKGGKDSSCRVTVPAIDASTTFRADGSRRISVEYAGDKVFGPSEGSLVMPDQSAVAPSSAPETTLLDDVGQLLDTALEILALQRQELLEIGEQLP